MNNLRLLLVMSFTAVPLLRAESLVLHSVAAEPRSAVLVQASNRPMSALVGALDTDRDGTLSASEITWAPAALQALDANSDGVLTTEEIRPAPGAQGWTRIRHAATETARSRVPAGFTVAFTLDANHDGAIQPMEIANAVSSLRTLDANRDGNLTPEELRPVVQAPTVTA